MMIRLNYLYAVAITRWVSRRNEHLSRGLQSRDRFLSCQEFQLQSRTVLSNSWQTLINLHPNQSFVPPVISNMAPQYLDTEDNFDDEEIDFSGELHNSMAEVGRAERALELTNPHQTLGSSTKCGWRKVLMPS